MSDLALYPTSIPCGFCEASTALERHQVDNLSIGQGRCPECHRFVFSVAGPLDAVQVFLDWLDSVDFSFDQDLSRLAASRPEASGYRAAAFN
jgi:hypothetical protein